MVELYCKRGGPLLARMNALYFKRRKKQMTTKQLREMNRLSQHEFADKLGISQNAVSKWEMKDTN